MMKRDRITINGNMVSITGSNVWMTDYEITDLLGVTSSAVCNHVKSIFKSGVLSESDTYRYILLENGNRADAYNMEMITALAFRLNSLPAKIFREWVVKKAVTPTRSAQHIVLQIGNGFPC
nr:hypothetical protein [Bacteroides intestinalis]